MLRFSTPVSDAIHPDRIVFTCHSDYSGDVNIALENHEGETLVKMTIPSAILRKFVANQVRTARIEQTTRDLSLMTDEQVLGLEPSDV